jgi:hypothetical protein
MWVPIMFSIGVGGVTFAVLYGVSEAAPFSIVMGIIAALVAWLFWFFAPLKSKG